MTPPLTVRSATRRFVVLMLELPTGGLAGVVGRRPVVLLGAGCYSALLCLLLPRESGRPAQSQSTVSVVP